MKNNIDFCGNDSIKHYSNTVVLTDENVSKFWQGPGIKIIIPPGEKEKNIETVKIIWKKMFETGLDRQSLLINFGGGVITDLGGFCASTFMRGIDFINIPTTLLAMVDAASGGKCGINFGGNKNIIGTFANPVKIVIDVDLLRTLPDREFIAGFGEIIKYGIICDREYFNFVISKKPREFDKKELIKIVKKSVFIKSEIVKNDPKEKRERKKLNFGHTIGHAIESLSLQVNKPLLHGEAVAIGMVAESKLAQFLGILTDGDFRKIKKGISQSGLPIRISDLSIQKIKSKIMHDKKNQGNKILWSLPKKIGEVDFNIEVPDRLIVEVVKYIQV